MYHDDSTAFVICYLINIRRFPLTFNPLRNLACRIPLPIVMTDIEVYSQFSLEVLSVSGIRSSELRRKTSHGLEAWMTKTDNQSILFLSLSIISPSPHQGWLSQRVSPSFSLFIWYRLIFTGGSITKAKNPMIRRVVGKAIRAPHHRGPLKIRIINRDLICMHASYEQ